MTVPEVVEDVEQVENNVFVSRKSLRKSNEADNRSTGSKKTKTPVKEEPKLFDGPLGFKQATLTQIPVTN